MVINNCKQNFSILFTSAMSNFAFINFHKFQTPVQKFDFGLIKFESEFKTVYFQYTVTIE